MLALAWGATLIGALPLLWLAALAARGHRRHAPWWWMAAAFGVSFVADVAGGIGYAPLASQTYPVMQAAIFSLVLLPRRIVEAVVAVVLVAAAVSLGVHQGDEWDVVLHVVAWVIVSGVAFVRLSPGTLRTTLAGGFALLVPVWLAYVAWPGWGTWGAFQTVRLAMAAAWGLAAWQAGRHDA